MILLIALMATATQSILTSCDNQPTRILDQKKDGSLKKSEPIKPAQCHHQVNPVAILKDLFDQMLSDCNYTQDCIKDIRIAFPNDVSIIDEVLEQEYIREYRKGTSNMPYKEKIETLDGLKLRLTRDDYAIEKGHDNAIIRAHDGSDRGVFGLRMQALVKVKKETELAQN